MPKTKKVKMTEEEVLKHYIPLQELPAVSPPGTNVKEINDKSPVSEPVFIKADVEIDRIMAGRKSAVIKTNQRSTKKWRKSPTKKKKH
jgi:hypothetical protein